jgi:hypothetical protein
MPVKKLTDFLEKQRIEASKNNSPKAGEKSSLTPIPQTLDAEVALYCI